MTANDDLARWGEPPATQAELALANLLAELLDASGAELGRTRSGTASPPLTRQDERLLEASGWIEQMIATVLTHTGLFENMPLPADAGGPAKPASARGVDLRLRVLRQVGPATFHPVASTHPKPMVLRDLRRVPEDADRVTLRTGDRVRLEVHCDHDGHVTVFNVGPGGALNLLYPDEVGRGSSLRAGTPLVIADVELMPPAGRERLYAVWSRVPLGPAHLAWLVRPGVVVRDMQRVQETLAQLRPEDWHAVMLELEHRG